MKGILRMTGWLVVAAALMAGTSACNTADKLQPEDAASAPKTYTLTVTATKGDDDTTRALTLTPDGKTLNVTWEASDHVTVMKDIGGMSQEYGTLMPTKISANGLTCTLTGVLMRAPSQGDELTLRYRNGGYGSQEGTLAYIADNCDIAIATVTVASVDNGQITTTSAANFVSQQAIVKFTLKRPDGTTRFAATSLNVKYGKKTYKVTPAGAMSELYVAIPGGSATVSLEATDGTDTYFYKKTGVTFANGQYYAVGVTMKDGTVDLAAATGDVALKDGDVAYGTLAGNYKVSIASSAEVTLNGATIPGNEGDAGNWAGIECFGSATINLLGTNTVRAYGKIYPGIYIPSNRTLTIQGDGVLNVSTFSGAGIGGGSDSSTTPSTPIDCGNIVIKGGTITATGGGRSAGIGSGWASTCGDITISGGNVTANGASGIGTGNYGTCGAIKISGGSVTATGKTDGTGIGSGSEGICSSISISGGTVTATGGSFAAGIGTGNNGTCGAIKISDGTVTATSANYGAGIGVGNNGICGNISISGGIVSATGTRFAAGIGTGTEGTCGNITITDKVTSVTANRGNFASYTIGKSRDENTCGTVIIGGTTYYDGSNFLNDGDFYLGTNPFIYQP